MPEAPGLLRRCEAFVVGQGCVGAQGQKLLCRGGLSVHGGEHQRRFSHLVGRVDGSALVNEAFYLGGVA